MATKASSSISLSASDGSSDSNPAMAITVGPGRADPGADVRADAVASAAPGAPAGVATAEATGWCTVASAFGRPPTASARASHPTEAAEARRSDRSAEASEGAMEDRRAASGSTASGSTDSARDATWSSWPSLVCDSSASRLSSSCALCATATGKWAAAGGASGWAAGAWDRWWWSAGGPWITEPCFDEGSSASCFTKPCEMSSSMERCKVHRLGWWKVKSSGAINGYCAMKKNEDRQTKSQENIEKCQMTCKQCPSHIYSMGNPGS